jgi:hypothetical protein
MSSHVSMKVDGAGWLRNSFGCFDLLPKDCKLHISKSKLQSVAVLAMTAAAVVFTGGSALAQDKVQLKTQDKVRDQDRLNDSIYGSQLMTLAERNEFRRHMSSLKSNQAREAYRLEHHERMQERAREKGVTLPDVPPALGKGIGPAPAAGGMGSGVGAGGTGGGMGAGSNGKK